MTATLSNRSGQLLGDRYLLEERVGEGSQAVTYRAVDRVTKQLVAAKLIKDPSTIESFRRQIDFRGCDHPGVNLPFACEQFDGDWYLFEAFIEGDDLNLYVANKGEFGIRESIEFLKQLASAFDAFHPHYVHRDIKPENIRITPSNQVVVYDFGIAKDIMSTHSVVQPKGFAGTCPYVSPQQFFDANDVNYLTDFWSAGVTWYFLLTEQYPFTGTDMASLATAICQQDPIAPCKLNRAIPTLYNDVLLRMLSKNPADRFQSGTELIAALDGNPCERFCCRTCGKDLSCHRQSNYCHHCGAALNQTQTDVPLCFACGTAVGQSDTCPGCHRTFGRVNHVLIGRSGSLQNRRFRVPEGEYDVGRAQLSSRDRLISRVQMRVACLNGTLAISNLSQSNTTTIAGVAAASPTTLQPNHDVSIANNALTYALNAS